MFKVKRSPPHSPLMDDPSSEQKPSSPNLPPTSSSSSSSSSSSTSSSLKWCTKQGGGSSKPILVKQEPGVEPARDTACSRKVLTRQGSSSSSSSSSPVSVTVSHKPGSRAGDASCASVKGKTGRSRRSSIQLPMAQSNMDDTGNDLALTADDIFTGKIGGTPLLKPLEEEEDGERVSDTGQSPLNLSVSGVLTCSPTLTTQTQPSASSCSVVSTTSTSNTKEQPKDTELKKELDVFFKVMNEVERVEKAKERRASLSSFPFPPPTAISSTQTQGSSMQHLISPPPYSSASTTHRSAPPTGQHQQLRQYLTSSVSTSGRSIPPPLPQDSGYTAPPSALTNNFPKSLPPHEANPLYLPSLHHQHHPHIPPSSPHTPVLISPTSSQLVPCSSSHPHPPTPTTPYDPMVGFHQHQALPSHAQTTGIQPPPVEFPQGQLTSGYPTQHRIRGSSFSYSMAEPSDSSWSNPAVSYHQFMSAMTQTATSAGQKRSNSLPQCLPPAKVPHTNLPQAPSSSQLISHYLPLSTSHTGATPYPSGPPPYPHL